MRLRHALLGAAAIVAVIAAKPVYAQQLAIELLPGHPLYDAGEQKAGVAMALSTKPDHVHAADFAELCEELRVLAGLERENGDGLRLETIFVVPRKRMAVEGYYLPDDGTLERHALVRGNGVARGSLDAVVTRAGFPAHILDETNVEHEISCTLGEPAWHVVWHDVRSIGDEEPDAVIERARSRFMAVHQSVVEHNAQAQHVHRVKRPRLPGTADG